MASAEERLPRAGFGGILKRILVGRAMASYRLEHTLLPKVLALPVFSSDALSSVAYATEEILRVLVLAAGLQARHLVMPISFAIATLMVIVVASYRQTVRAYPNGGGAYIVSRENLGTLPGLTAAAALLTDYVLTVSVSVVAGVFAITSASPGLAEHKVLLSIGFVVLITLANLRGVKESGTLFAIPTYGFILSIFVMLAVGMSRCLTGGCPQAGTPLDHVPFGAAGAASLFVILHAFSSGSTALTGVEAISNGVPAFRRPQARNAATTLGIMGAISVTMFLGISFLAQHGGAIPSDSKSVVAQIADGVFGGGFFFYMIQVFTAAILILAANTSYQDFPRLSSILARDRFLPGVFKNRGDRLVFSNGVILLAVFSSLLIYAFSADLSRLIQLYVVGVFTSFTLSQTGMVRHWLKVRRRGGEEARGWQRSIAINAVGAVATFVVLVVVIQTKFLEGAWIVISAIPVLILGMLGINRHYASVAQQLRRGAVAIGEIAQNTIVLLVTSFDAATAEALGYVRSLRAADTRFVYVPGPEGAPTDLDARWASFAGEAPVPRLTALEGAHEHPGKRVREYVRSIERGPNDFVTVVIPEMVRGSSLLQVLRAGIATRVKLRLLSEPGVAVANVPVQVVKGRPVDVDGRPLIPRFTSAMVFVSAVHDGTIRAVNYAKSLHASETKAVYAALDPEEIVRMEDEWSKSGIDIPLEIVEVPFRDLGTPVLEEVRRVTARPDALALVVLPEIVVKKWWHNLLHNNSGLFIKRLLLQEPRVVLTSVPLHPE